MYIEIHEWQTFEQKTLYFKLNNSFNMNIQECENHKIAGIYAIYKEDVCLYVGQSKNMASRIATHLKGKYKSATDIFIWRVEDIGFPDFIGKNIDAQNEILNNCENWLMSKLKPIENLIIDMDFTLKENQIPYIEFDKKSSITMSIKKYSLIILDCYSSVVEDIFCIIDMINYEHIINDAQSETLKYFIEQDYVSYIYDKGVCHE